MEKKETNCVTPKIEEWREINGYNGRYFISSLGRLKSVNSPKFKNKGDYITIGSIDFAGYLTTSLRKDNKKKDFRLHTLVALSFIPNPYNKRTVNHKNGIKTDNRLENLEWATHKENCGHAVKTGLHSLKGEKHPMAKLNADQVRQIRSLGNDGFTQQSIADKFDINRRHVGEILSGENWGWLI